MTTLEVLDEENEILKAGFRAALDWLDDQINDDVKLGWTRSADLKKILEAKKLEPLMTIPEFLEKLKGIRDQYVMTDNYGIRLAPSDCSGSLCPILAVAVGEGYDGPLANHMVVLAGIFLNLSKVDVWCIVQAADGHYHTPKAIDLRHQMLDIFDPDRNKTLQEVPIEIE